MELHLLDYIPVTFDIEQISRLLMIDTDQDREKLELMLKEASGIVRPKALYACAFIDDTGNDCVVIEGIKFTSRVLRVNLEGVHRCFPYIATCGTEIDEWSEPMTDIIESYWADVIKQQALAQATLYLNEKMEKVYNLGKTSMMNPGSLQDWPIEEQRNLFRLLGDKVRDTGIILTESCLMKPIKSVSGIRFETESGFENCMLCPRKNCPGRHTQYSPELRKKYV